MARKDQHGSWFEWHQKDVHVVIEARPSYCDRGRWYVKIINPGPMWIDAADGFPRYYFDLDIAKSETEAFLRCRKIL